MTVRETRLLERAATTRFEIVCDLLAHKIAPSHKDCTCDKCAVLRPIPSLLAELAETVRRTA